MWYVYILKSTAKNWHYVGSTNDIKRRIDDHNAGRSSSTKFYRPLVLVYKENYKDEKAARSREHEIKRNRKLKESLLKQIYCRIV